jgi:hypothetical protein
MTASTYVLTNGKSTILAYPYTISQLLMDNPLVSFPFPVPDSVAADYNVFPVEDTDRPDFDSLTQDLSLDKPVKKGDSWLQVWTVKNASADEKKARLAGVRSGLAVSVAQGKLQLHAQGLLDKATAAVASGDPVAKITWDHAQVWRRDSDFAAFLGKSLGLNDTALDDFFKAAQQIAV